MPLAKAAHIVRSEMGKTNGEVLDEILEIAEAPGFATRSGDPGEALDVIVELIQKHQGKGEDDERLHTE